VNPIAIVLATTLTASAAIATEFNLSRRVVQIEVGTACQHLEDGQPLDFVQDQLAQNLKERGLTQLQITQASRSIMKLIKKACK
jgi:hypothetical protein